MSPEPKSRPALVRDPRLYQIVVLSALFGYGTFGLGFEVDALQAGIVLATALATQWLWTRVLALGPYDPKSPLISGLSLVLLLRSNSWLLLAVAAFVAISSKFLLRFRGKHVFNPTNFAIVALLMTGGVWVSPGQWGSLAYFAFLLACLGGLVLQRARRSDVTYAFLLFYGGFVFARALWLGDPLTLPLHHLQSGAFLLFAFFMISDPKTTPDSRLGRVVFAGLVALGAFYVQFGLFRTNGLLWSLAACALLVPILDRLLPGDRYRWHGRIRRPAPAVSRPLPVPTALLLVEPPRRNPAHEWRSP